MNDSEVPNPSPNEVVSQQGAEIKPLYRGIWADEIKNGDKISVGGHALSDELDIFMQVDTEWLDEAAKKFTKENVDSAFVNGNEKIFSDWIVDHGGNLDPELFHNLFQVQKTMERVLKVDDADPAQRIRRDKYLDNDTIPKLSDFVGSAECVEKAVVGKLLLDKLGVRSTVMSGVHLDDPADDPGDHTFLVLDEENAEGSIVFDIARPKASLEGYPRIMRTKNKVTYETFRDQNNLVVPARDIYDGKVLNYGVGNRYLDQVVQIAA